MCCGGKKIKKNFSTIKFNKTDLRVSQPKTDIFELKKKFCNIERIFWNGKGGISTFSPLFLSLFPVDSVVSSS